ncbi:hypothetical protein [Actinomadura nitritigenes]|uniref:hypothetical protein n=1 Tax=Actinomadura nitritigenes TaxID=134602 RepID=UPI003D8D09BE
MAVPSIPVDRIRAEARELRPGRGLLTLLFLIPFLLGWSVGALWTGLAWMWAAVVAGYRQGAGRTGAAQDGEAR